MIDRLYDIWNSLRDTFVRQGACTWVRARLAACIDLDIDPRDYVRIEQHLAACDACRQEHEELRRFLGETFAAVRPPEFVEARRARLLAAVDRLRDLPAPVPAARPRAVHVAWPCGAVAVALFVACCLFPLLNRDDQASGNASADDRAVLVRIPRHEPFAESVNVEAAMVELDVLLHAMTEDNTSRIAAEIADSPLLARCLLHAVAARASDAGADAAELGERAKLLLERQTSTNIQATGCLTRAAPEEIEPLLRRLAHQDQTLATLCEEKALHRSTGVSPVPERRDHRRDACATVQKGNTSTQPMTASPPSTRSPRAIAVLALAGCALLSAASAGPAGAAPSVEPSVELVDEIVGKLLAGLDSCRQIATRALLDSMISDDLPDLPGIGKEPKRGKVRVPAAATRIDAFSIFHEYASDFDRAGPNGKPRALSPELAAKLAEATRTVCDKGRSARAGILGERTAGLLSCVSSSPCWQHLTASGPPPTRSPFPRGWRTNEDCRLWSGLL